MSNRTFAKGDIIRYTTRGRRPMTTTILLDFVHDCSDGKQLSGGRIVLDIGADGRLSLSSLRRIQTSGDLARAEIIERPAVQS